MNTTVMIRLATSKDAAEMLKIYAHYVVNTAISFEYEVPSEEEFRERIESILKRYPYIVAEQEAISSAMLMYRFSMRERLMIGLWKHRFMWIKTTNAAAAENFCTRHSRRFSRNSMSAISMHVLPIRNRRMNI